MLLSRVSTPGSLPPTFLQWLLGRERSTLGPDGRRGCVSELLVLIGRGSRRIKVVENQQMCVLTCTRKLLLALAPSRRVDQELQCIYLFK